jgi:hypothetical protein
MWYTTMLLLVISNLIFNKIKVGSPKDKVLWIRGIGNEESFFCEDEVASCFPPYEISVHMFSI